MARDQGILDVDKMLDNLPADLFLEWFYYYGGSPSLGARIDYAGGLVSAVLANLRKKRGTRAYQPSQFAPHWDRYFDSFEDPEGVKRPRGEGLVKKFKRIWGMDMRKH